MTSKRPELSLLWAIRRSFVSIGQAVEVGLDRRRRAAEPIGDLHDRQTLRLSIVASKRNSAPTLNDPISHRARDARRHHRDGTAADWCSDFGTLLSPHIEFADTDELTPVRSRVANSRHPLRRLTR